MKMNVRGDGASPSKDKAELRSDGGGAVATQRVPPPWFSLRNSC